MLKSISLFAILFLAFNLTGQVKVDLDKSVPLWLEYDSNTNMAKLKWIADENATTYDVSEVSNETNLTALGTLTGEATEYEIGELIKGEEYGFHIRKDVNARGIIECGLELPAIHKRGKCLILIDKILPTPLETEIDQLIDDIGMDGWEVDTLHISQNEEVVGVKSKISDWYDEDYDRSQSLFLLGHIPVPYSGNTQHDGHTNHQGAWAADVFYGDMDGTWSDEFVNNTSPSRDKNDNIPGDGKYDQTGLPSDIDIEIGRVDFNDLPAFPDDEIELTRQYLNKSHDFKMGNKDYPRRALVENNFGSFAEGFGQSGWRNFTTMFGGDSVSVKNYDVVLENEKYLCSYACGGGSYTSCSGVGTTANLWVAKDIQTVFTLNFGSYFGDWDSQNNFLRSALGSGDILVNAWAGRPVWQLYHMSVGRHIGHSARITQNATGTFYSQSFSARSAHIALMGDPTLRLHAVKSADALTATFADGDVQLNWNESADASHGYYVYRKKDNEDWQLIADFVEASEFLDVCVDSNTDFAYMVKAIKLEQTGSGTYFNTSLGITTSLVSGENPFLNIYYADADMDGFGNAENFVSSCAIPPGFAENDLDCDDMNFDINPNGEEIPNNGIDEDCDGEDLLVGVDELEGLEVSVYPNPAQDYLFIESKNSVELFYKLYNSQGSLLKSDIVNGKINLKEQSRGVYWIEINSKIDTRRTYKKVIIQ